MIHSLAFALLDTIESSIVLRQTRPFHSDRRMPPAASLRLFCWASQKFYSRQHSRASLLHLRPHSAFDRLNLGRTKCTAQCTQPLQDRPSVATVSFDEVLHTFRLCEELIAAEGKRLAGNEAPSHQDLQTELSWLFEDAIESASAKGGPEPIVAAQLRSSAGINYLEGRDFRVRISLDDLLTLWQRRIKERCPLQYLVGACHWRDVVLAVGPGVLIPRPETENIIDFCEDAIHRHPELASGCWVDLGTGSGALACGVARLMRASAQKLSKGAPLHVVAVDLSPVAVEYAQLNAERLGVNDIVDVRHGSWCQPCSDLHGSVDGLVSNPPYIPAGDMPNLQLEVQRHEPHEALSDGGTDGMDSLSQVLSCAALLLRPGGFFAFETNGEVQARELERTAGQAVDRHGKRVFEMVAVQSDYFGCHRFCTGFKARSYADTTA